MELSALLGMDDHEAMPAVSDSNYLLDDPDSKQDISNFFDVTDQILGDGSYAVVYKARHRTTSKAVAVKVINKRLLFSASEREAVKREVKIWRTLQHDACVRLYEVFESKTSISLVMEQSDFTLDWYLKRQPSRTVPEAVARSIFRQIVQGVHYMSEHGFIHGDIKPQNILLTGVESEDTQGLPQFKVQLCDFGMAQIVSFETPLTGVIGTAGYIAPEVLDGQPYSYPVDMWSCGVVLYQMLFGSLPFRQSNDRQLHFPEGLGLSDEVLALMCGLLREHAPKRLHSHQVLQHPWLQETPS